MQALLVYVYISANTVLHPTILETAVGRAGVCDFCELSPGGEMPAYPTWGAVQGATRAWLLPL